MAISYSEKSVLIVDDFETFRKSLKKMVNDLGVVNIDMVATAKDVIKACQLKSYDIILMDYNLGKGKNGQQLLEELRTKKLLKHVSVIIMTTAETSQEMVLSAIEHQPDAYLAKPFAFNLLKSRLDKTLTRSQALFPILSALDDDNYTAAITFCDKYINEGGRYKKWCIKAKADLLFRLDRYDEALLIYQEQLSERQEDWALLGQGKAYSAQKKYSEALDAFKLLLAANPMFMEVYDWIAKMHLALNDPDTAQHILERAVSISPRSFVRLHNLAQVCEQNNDMEKATKAFRRTLELSENSIHFSADNSFELANCLTSFAEQSEGNEADKLTQEALNTLGNLSNKFKSDVVVKIKSKLIESKAYHTMKDPGKAQAALDNAMMLSESMGEEDNPEVLIELASTYTHANDTEKAQSILNELGKKHANNEAIMDKIEKLSEKPFSDKAKAVIKESTQKGIELYESGDFESSIIQFTGAVRKFPKHVGLQLNLVQALLGALDKNPSHEKNYQKCQACLNQVKKSSSLVERRERYQELSDKFDKIVRMRK